MSTRRAGGHYGATMQLYVDGELLSREAVKISTFNHGLHYGDGVFDRIVIDDLEQEAKMSKPMVASALVAGDLSGLVCGDLPGRKSARELTAFVFRGTALGDLALAGLAYCRAKATGVLPA